MGTPLCHAQQNDLVVPHLQKKLLECKIDVGITFYTIF